MTYTIAIANQKGGVAKTTTVVSLAGAFAQIGLSILLIDLDAQADLTLALGLQPGKVHGSISDVLLNSRSLLSVSRETPIANIDIVPSNQEMDLAERFLPIRQRYEYILRDILRTQLPEHAYDLTLIDCPPLLGSVTTNAMIAADLVIVPSQPEYFSIHALRNMLVAIRKIRQQNNHKLLYRVLITMKDQRNRIHRNLSEQLRTTFKEGVLQTEIGVDTKLRESSVAGLPITHYKARTRSAEQYTALAEEIYAYVQKTIA